MEIVFKSTEQFEQDLKTFTEAERELIIQEINQSSPILLSNKMIWERRLHQFHQFNLVNGYTSSLYSFIVNYYIRVLLTIDSDPIFEQVAVILFQAVNTNQQDVSSIYRQVGNSLYQQVLG
ncbi:MAG: hypothetical protein ACFBSC_14555 [Microcoleaceae cyanobacterium]